MDPFTISLLVSGAVSVVGGIFSGWAKNEENKKKLELEKQANSYSALATASQNTQATYSTAMGIESQLAGFESQIDKYATQATQATGSLNARSASTGFRNTGANINAKANQLQQSKFDISYLNSNIESTKNQVGANNISQFNSYSNSMNGYKLNIKQAVETLDVADNYWTSGRFLEDGFTSLLNWGASTASSWAGSEMGNAVAKRKKVEY